MSRKWVLWPVLLVIASCAGVVTAPRARTLDTGTPDTDISLGRGSVFDVATPDVVNDRTLEPGGNALLPRAFEETPPLVPHGIGDMLPITFDSNFCIDCHLIEETEGETTPIPASHFTDLRRSPDKVGEKLAGARYNCVLCHVAPGSSTPLPVGNTFGSTSP